MRIVRTILAAGLAQALLCLSGCGGGGGGGGGGGSEQPPSIAAEQFVVLAWNDLGMHCLNPTYDEAVILPPYNTLVVQVVRRGAPPKIVTSDVQVEYRLVGNTYSYGKRSYGQFWDNAQALFGVTLAKDTGLNLEDPAIHNGLSGSMVLKGDRFQANGVPVVPVDDAGVWNPYQVAEITVKDAGGAVLAQTRATVPTSDEIHCDKCHGVTVDPFLALHDANRSTTLEQQKPVLCASCHGTPALGAVSKPGIPYLSKAIHGFHGTLDPAARPTCYDCHPGVTTKCNRSLAHTASDGSCVTCHGSLSEVASSIDGGRVPWATEPKCVTCHGGVPEVDTGAALYRDATGHGGLRCAACHGSPHAMVPSREASDHYQALQYQDAALTLGSCRVCHESSHGEGLEEFGETHGGATPEHRTACTVCHTAVAVEPTKWPHAFHWRTR